jgi:multiple sugar transport system permease protein
LPAVPGIVVAAVFAFIFVWTEFFFALNLTSRTAFTLPTIFRAFLGFQASQYGEASALAVTSLVPFIVLGMLVQRHLVRGLTLGAVQGWSPRRGPSERCDPPHIPACPRPLVVWLRYSVTC